MGKTSSFGRETPIYSAHMWRQISACKQGRPSVPRQGLRRLLTLLTPERTLEVQVPHFGLTIVPSFDFSLAPKGSSALVLELVFFLCHATAASSGTQWPEPWQVLFPQRKGPTHAVEHARPSLPCFLVVQNRSLYYETWGRAQFSKLNSDDRGDRFAHGGDQENGEETALQSTTSLIMAAVSATATSTAAAATTTVSAEDRPHDNLIATFNAVIWVLAGLSGFFLFMRVYCKVTRDRKLWWDDYVMGASWVRPLCGCPWLPPSISCEIRVSTNAGTSLRSWPLASSAASPPRWASASTAGTSTWRPPAGPRPSSL